MRLRNWLALGGLLWMCFACSAPFKFESSGGSGGGSGLEAAEATAVNVVNNSDHALYVHRRKGTTGDNWDWIGSTGVGGTLLVQLEVGTYTLVAISDDDICPELRDGSCVPGCTCDTRFFTGADNNTVRTWEVY